MISRVSSSTRYLKEEKNVFCMTLFLVLRVFINMYKANLYIFFLFSPSPLSLCLSIYLPIFFLVFYHFFSISTVLYIIVVFSAVTCFTNDNLKFQIRRHGSYFSFVRVRAGIIFTKNVLS